MFFDPVSVNFPMPTPFSRIHYFLNLKLKYLVVILLNEVSVRLSFFFIDELGCNECINLSGGNYCINLILTINKIFVQLLIRGFDQGSDWKFSHFFRIEFSDSFLIFLEPSLVTLPN